MVLRCSLLGHDYGEPQVEREREERGSEVVTTVVEYEKCTRCGAIHVRSENTEVTSLWTDSAAESADDGDGSEPATTPAVDSTANAASPAPDAERPVDDAERPVDDAERPVDDAERPVDDAPDDDGIVLPSESTDETAGSAAEPDTGTSSVQADFEGEPITDDGEILEDEPSDDRKPGQWPDPDVGESDEPSDEPAAWPDVDPDEGAALSPEADVVVEDEGVVLDADSAADNGPPASRTAEPASGIESAESAPSPTERAPADGVATEFFCPRCEFLAAGDRGSLRAGDICPECRKGYLGERAR